MKCYFKCSKNRFIKKSGFQIIHTSLHCFLAELKVQRGIVYDPSPREVTTSHDEGFKGPVTNAIEKAF